jgi:hypothetical protein
MAAIEPIVLVGHPSPKKFHFEFLHIKKLKKRKRKKSNISSPHVMQLIEH